MTLATHEEVIEPEIVRDATEWVEVIRDDLGRAVEGIVSAGKHLIAAKADVNHGEWLPMLKEIGISDGYARKLMSIGRNGAISNRSHGNDFPTAMRALYELSRLDPEDIESGIESGDINPDMTIKDAKNYAQPEQPVSERGWPEVPAPRPEPEAETRPNGENRYTDLINGTRNDLKLIGGNLRRYVEGLGKEVPNEKLPPKGNQYIVQYLRDTLADIASATEDAIRKIEGGNFE